VRRQNEQELFAEQFSWIDANSPEVAHKTPEVMAVWEPMGALCDGMEFMQTQPVPMPLRMGKAQQQLKELDAALTALAHESRRHILLVVWFRGGAMSAGEIAARFSCTWPTTSRHLACCRRWIARVGEARPNADLPSEQAKA